jgi:GT2 family glycosyltransferase
MLVLSLLRYAKSRIFKNPAHLNADSISLTCAPLESGADGPLVSIIIPTRDKADLLDKCIRSVLEKTNYKNFEILVVNNQSQEEPTFELFGRLRKKGVRLIDFDQPFNFSSISNLAIGQSAGDYVCLLNNDTEVLTGDWLGAMLAHATKRSSGFVGSILLSPGGMIQHAGLAFGFSGIAEHVYKGKSKAEVMPSKAINECHAVEGLTFACVLISKQKYVALGGLSEVFAVGLNDVDACVSANQSGMQNIVCANAVLCHLESATRPKAFSVKGAGRALAEVLIFLAKHPFSSLRDRYHGSFIAR